MEDFLCMSNEWRLILLKCGIWPTLLVLYHHVHFISNNKNHWKSLKTTCNIRREVPFTKIATRWTVSNGNQPTNAVSRWQRYAGSVSLYSKFYFKFTYFTYDFLWFHIAYLWFIIINYNVRRRGISLSMEADFPIDRGILK